MFDMHVYEANHQHDIKQQFKISTGLEISILYAKNASMGENYCMWKVLEYSIVV